MTPGPKGPGVAVCAEDGSLFEFPEFAAVMPRATRERIIEQQQRVIEERIRALRGGQPLPTIAGRTVILVDDGIAMGSTMRASILLCRNREARRIVVASPVAGPRVAREMARLADEAVILETPRDFGAMAQVYEEWHDVPEEEALGAMRRLPSRTA